MPTFTIGLATESQSKHFDIISGVVINDTNQAQLGNAPRFDIPGVMTGKETRFDKIVHSA